MSNHCKTEPDSEFSLRLCQYSLEYLANRINDVQKQIIDAQERIKHFPDTALSDYSVQWGQREPLKKVQNETKQGIEHYKERLRQYESDYEILAVRMNEYSEMRLEALVKAAFGKERQNV